MKIVKFIGKFLVFGFFAFFFIGVIVSEASRKDVTYTVSVQRCASGIWETVYFTTDRTPDCWGINNDDVASPELKAFSPYGDRRLAINVCAFKVIKP